MFYRPEARPETLRYNPIKALVSPRPIAWVSTIDGDGVANLAPYSFFNIIHDAPPIVMIGPNGPKPDGEGAAGERKDTLANILETGEFVVSIVGFAQADQMNRSSGGYPAGVDEFEVAGVPKAACELVKPPRPANAPASFECKFLQRLTFPTHDPKMEAGAVFGEVVGVHIDDAVIRDGKVDVTLYEPLSRLGYMDYAKVSEVFSLKRPS